MNNTASDKRLTNSNFGAWGWSMVIFTFFLYYFWAGIGTDGLNLYPQAFGAMHGWNPNTLLGFATPAGIFGIIGGIVFGRLVLKLRSRKTAFISLVLTGVCYMFFGFATSPGAYFAFLSLFTFFSVGFGLICTATIMGNWFPRKKGIALGWATMGAPVCTATFVQLLALLLNRFGVRTAFLIMGAIVVVFGIIALFWAKDYPEEVGAYPDNLPPDESFKSTSIEELENYKSPFTIGRLLKDKDFWLIALGFGLLWMVTVGIVSQFVPRMISVGYTQQEALNLLTIASLIACPGSYFWGWLDQKVGTKPASVVYALFYIIALILLINSYSTVAAYVACVFVGVGIGGLLNLMPSMVISVYGRYDFAAANSMVSPIASLIRVFTFLVLAVTLTASQGDFTLPYIVFIVIDIIGVILLMLVTNKCKGKVDNPLPEEPVET
jgi:OFA family oxalate/formate antiporter-like MFS transporter